MENSKQIVPVTLKWRQLAEIDRIARRKEISRSEQLREMIDFYLHHMEGE